MNKFKVGDWVRIKSNNKVLQLPNHTSSTELSCIEFGGQQYFLDDIELWQPKEGEWCWFYTNTSKGKRFINPQLGKFQNLVKQDTNTCKNGYRYVTDIGFFKQCEPFIGELPSFLKENNNAIN